MRATSAFTGAALLSGMLAYLLPGAGLAVVTGAVGLAVVGGVFAVRRTAQRRSHLIRVNDDAVALINSGRLREACSTLDALAGEAREDPALHALIAYNRGVATLRMGDAPAALSMLEAVAGSRWLNDPELPYRELLALALSQAYWSLGDPGTARAYLDTARETLSPARAGLTVSMEAVLALSMGQTPLALRVLREGRSAAEGVLVASQLRTLRVLEAFALTRLDPAHEHGDEVRRLLDGARPVQPWDHVGLRSVWPEFDAFCRIHGLEAPGEHRGDRAAWVA
ncbi:MAG: hypothetical protein EA398_15930 [Deltaproteobacteria bacterium]|nr:MAG: hypothetical protein EA398_15930 [Deltaproteobacteria bacterium]